MSESDKEVFKQGRPYVVGIVALLFQLRTGLERPVGATFEDAEAFVREFEKRNGL